MGVVHRHAYLELVLAGLADVDVVGKHQGMADGPARRLLVAAFGHAPLDDAFVERVEPNLEVVTGEAPEPRPLRGVFYPELLAGPQAEPPVRPLGVNGVNRVLLALKPVGVEDRRADLPIAVFPHEGAPTRQQGRGLRAEVGEDEPAQLLDGVGQYLDAAGEGAVGVLRGHLEALTVGVVHPAVIGATQPLVLRDAVLELDAAVRAALGDRARGRRCGP